ncbi:hypothetical protein J6590_074214 [Homalodisca vitripennis]|nr:hypothetical protein J6590_074214 [Homalodisca vitripennis]
MSRPLVSVCHSNIDVRYIHDVDSFSSRHCRIRWAGLRASTERVRVRTKMSRPLVSVCHSNVDVRYIHDVDSFSSRHCRIRWAGLRASTERVRVRTKMSRPLVSVCHSNIDVRYIHDVDSFSSRHCRIRWAGLRASTERVRVRTKMSRPLVSEDCSVDINVGGHGLVACRLVTTSRLQGLLLVRRRCCGYCRMTFGGCEVVTLVKRQSEVRSRLAAIGERAANCRNRSRFVSCRPPAGAGVIANSYLAYYASRHQQQPLTFLLTVEYYGEMVLNETRVAIVAPRSDLFRVSFPCGTGRPRLCLWSWAAVPAERARRAPRCLVFTRETGGCGSAPECGNY